MEILPAVRSAANTLQSLLGTKGIERFPDSKGALENALQQLRLDFDFGTRAQQSQVRKLQKCLGVFLLINLDTYIHSWNLMICNIHWTRLSDMIYTSGT